jgi:DNA-nicking Smr family endonuclease
MSSLDLHGIKHSEVQKLMDSFLFENMKSKQTKVEIITGLSDQMKNVVKKVLEDYDFEFEEDFLNKGKINVKIS